MWGFEVGADPYYGAIKDSDGRRINRSEDVFITTAQEIILAHDDEVERLTRAATAAEQEVERLTRLVDTLSRALARYQEEEEEVGGDAPADHPYQRRGSWSGDDWCAVEGCTSKASAHP